MGSKNGTELGIFAERRLSHGNDKIKIDRLGTVYFLPTAVTCSSCEFANLKNQKLLSPELC